jgi:phospholipase A-2-activating protein
LTRNDLPLTYIDEVAKFIEKNTSAVQIGNASEQYMDPFTGASRYIPREDTSTAPYVLSLSSPLFLRCFRAANYVPGPVGSANVDPFTGANRDSKPKILPVVRLQRMLEDVP